MTGEIPYESNVAAEAVRDCHEKAKEGVGKDPICWAPSSTRAAH